MLRVMPRTPRLPPWLVLLLYFAGTVVVGSVLAPWLFSLGRGYAAWAAGTGTGDTFLLGDLAREARKADFQRYFNRSTLVAALALLWPAARLLHVRHNELPGLWPALGDLRDSGLGFLLGVVPLLAMGGILVAMGVFKQNPKAVFASLAANAAVAAVAVALLEEWLFRGAITGIVGRSLPPRRTLVFVAVLFAVLHFMQPPETWRVADDAVNAGTGLQLAGAILGRLLDPGAFAGAFLTLLAIGLLLGWARLVTGRLWLGIGMHAGWVFALKAFSGMTRRVPAHKHGVPDLVIGGDIRTGLMPLGFLALTALALAWILRRRCPDAASRSGDCRETVA